MRGALTQELKVERQYSCGAHEDQQRSTAVSGMIQWAKPHDQTIKSPHPQTEPEMITPWYPPTQPQCRETGKIDWMQNLTNNIDAQINRL
ncbi:MAG: hypothetical protein LBQ32_03535 [Burkholderiaceae bacterium]|nr:hypothetical protein [Burkholderiaceae bacterium]